MASIGGTGFPVAALISPLCAGLSCFAAVFGRLRHCRYDSTPAPDEGWTPPPDEGQAGRVLLPNGWWGFRYKAGVRPLIVEKPEERDAPPGHVRRVRSSGSLIL